MTPAEYDFLRGFLKERSGLLLSDEKQYLIESRLLPVARRCGAASISDLARRLKLGPSGPLADAVVEAMTTNETFFFRDKTPFDHFTDFMLPALLKSRAATRRIRIWCAAASSGQEPYSLAMCLKRPGVLPAGWRVDIVGTDLSEAVLEKARSGVYSQFEVQRGLPIQDLVEHFLQEGEMWRVSPALRAMVDFRKLNLLDPFSHLGQFDIVYCRNVLIYFDHATKKDVLERLARQVPQDGHLVLGAAETVIGITGMLRPQPARRGVYAPAAATPAPRLAVVSS